MAKSNGKWLADIFRHGTLTGTPNGVAIQFGLPETPAYTNAVMVFVNGIFQTLGTDYTITTSNVEFTTAPKAGQSLTIFYVKKEA